MSGLKDYVQDLVKNVISTGFFTKIKITASANDILVEAMEENKDIVLKGKFLNPIPDIKGEFGLGNLSLLSHMISDNEFSSPDTKLEVVYDKSNNTPVEFSYENKSKSYINYRFMSAKLVADQPKFAEPKWDVVIKPTRNNIQQFNWAASGLAAYEQYFIPEIQDGKMKFFIGEDGGSNQRGGVVFASDLTEKFDGNFKWKISHIQPVLKLVDSTDCEMAFSNKGAIQMTINTGIGSYRFIFPAKAK